VTGRWKPRSGAKPAKPEKAYATISSLSIICSLSITEHFMPASGVTWWNGRLATQADLRYTIVNLIVYLIYFSSPAATKA